MVDSVEWTLRRVPWLLIESELSGISCSVCEHVNKLTSTCIVSAVVKQMMDSVCREAWLMPSWM